MMSLIEANYHEVIKRQYIFKLRTHFDLLYLIIISQMVGILLSFMAIGSSSSSFLSVNYYNSSIVIVLTLISMFVVSLNLATDNYRNMDFAFVTNRFTSNMSNILILISLALITALTATLSGALTRIALYFMVGPEKIALDGFVLTPIKLCMDFLTVMLISMLISSIGYLFGCLAQKNKAFILMLPVFLVGLIFILRTNGVGLNFIKNMFEFYFSEKSIFIYAIKLILTSIVFFAFSTLLTDKIEVRK